MRHTTRQRERERHHVNFIGIDGEGITDENGDHHYVLLSVGDQSYERNGRHLHHDEIFEFLYDQYLEQPDAAFVGFFLGYDFTQWLRTLTENRAEFLLSPRGIAARAPRGTRPMPYMVRIGHEWEIDLLGHKRFKLRPQSARGAKPAPTMYVCDAGPFFQSSLMTVLDPKDWPDGQYPISPEDYEIIKRGKQRRSTARFDTDMIHYNVTENRALSSVMTRLNEGFVQVGVRLKKTQWFGPGQAASAWLNEHCNHYSISAEGHTGVRDIVPEPVLSAATAAYYGGWFELYAHGHVPGSTWEYDINSAYPYAITRLPCLLHGKWVPNIGTAGHDDLTLVHASVTVDHPILGAMPCRSTDGMIFRPRTTVGWYWMDEIAALRRIPGLSIDVSYTSHPALDEDTWSWTYLPCPCPPPMHAVADLYTQRIELGPKGKNSPQGKALKLLYNSMYGKFAQSVGSPRFANPIWASRIPSSTRTQILSAIATHPRGVDDLMMVATDAVYFRTEHPGLELSGTALGAWDGQERSNMTLMMPGVYWDDRTRAAFAAGTDAKLKSRGISARALSACVAQLDDAFSGFDPVTTPALSEQAWPAAEIPLPFSMVSATLAVARHDWASAGRVSSTEVKRLSSWPMRKRDPSRVWWDRGALRTGRYDTTCVSVPYAKNFGMDLDRARDQDMITPDGDISTLFADAFRD